MSKSKIIFAILVLSHMAHAAGKNMDLLAFRDFLPNGDYRKTSGDDKSCPTGDFQWVDNGNILKIGTSEPVLFHSFNGKSTNDASTDKEKCVSETSNAITNAGTSATVEQTITNNCGGVSNATKYKMVVSKLKAKSTVTLNIHVVQANKKIKGVDSKCTYERTSEKN